MLSYQDPIQTMLEGIWKRSFISVVKTNVNTNPSGKWSFLKMMMSQLVILHFQISLV